VEAPNRNVTTVDAKGGAPGCCESMNEDCSEGPSRDHARKVTGDRNRRLGEKVPLQLRTVSPGWIATIYEYYIIKNKLKYRQEVAEPARPSRSVWPPNELSRGQTGSVSTPGQGRGGDGRLRVVDIGTDQDLEGVVATGGLVPAFAQAMAAVAGRGKPDRNPDALRQRHPCRGKPRAKLAGDK
jgi:hypothetical protein